MKRSEFDKRGILESLPPICAVAVRRCVARTGAPEATALVCCLGTISAAIGKGLAVRSGQGRLTRGNLYLVGSADSGAGKSEAFKELFGPLMGFEQGLRAWWGESATPKARAGQAILAQLSGGARRALVKGSLTLEEAGRMMSKYEHRRQALNLVEASPTLIADDATSQAIEIAMARSRGVLCWASPDARFLLRRLSKLDSREETLLLKSFSGDSLSTQRVTRSQLRIESPCLSCVLLSQPRAVMAFISKIAASESGLLGRFLFAGVAGEEAGMLGPALGRKGGGEVYATLLRDLLERFRFGKEDQLVEPTPQADSFLSAFAKEQSALAASASPVRQEILRRRGELAWRLALVLHAAREGTRAARQTLKLREAESAIWLLARVFPPAA